MAPPALHPTALKLSSAISAAASTATSANGSTDNSSLYFNALSTPPYSSPGRDEEFALDSVEEAVDAYRRGEFVVVMDDESRENEGDLLLPAAGVTAEQMAWMIKHTSGYICISLPPERLEELDIAMMVPDNQEKHKTAYTITVDYKHGTSTGISAADRALTARQLTPGSGVTPSDFTRPGHMVPLRYNPGGTLARKGHTEAATDLAKLAGLPAAGLLCELIKPDCPSGSMARRDDCWVFARRWGLKLVTVEGIARYRKEVEKGRKD